MLLALGVLWTSNILVSSLLGLGDAEALYYCYSRHLSLSYLDHPPLIGLLIRLSTALGGNSVLGVRLAPMAMCGLCLLFAYLCTAEIFGRPAGALCVLLMFSSPVFSIGLIAATPDAPLCALIMLFVHQMHRALTDPSDGLKQRLFRPMLLGAILGLAFLAKYTGACLVISTLILLLKKENRRRLKQPGVYLAGAIALLCALPVFWWNREHDWAGVMHRLIYTQADAGFSPRNLGALFGGQLLYLGPTVMVLFVLAARSFFKSNEPFLAKKRARGMLLILSLSILAPTYLLACWSKVAEPHWPAAGYLPLFVLTAGYIADAGRKIRRLFQWTLGLGVAVFFIAHIVVLTPVVPALTPESLYEAKYDLSNELRGWDEVAEVIRQIGPKDRPVIAAFYTQCSQLAFHLNKPDDPEVRCISPKTDDFDIWNGPFTLDSKGALFVTDNRFNHNLEDLLPHAKTHGETALILRRAGVPARRFELIVVNPE